MGYARQPIERFEVDAAAGVVRLSISDGLAIIRLSRDDAIRLATAMLVAAEAISGDGRQR